VRNSKAPENGMLLFTRPEVRALLQGIKAFEFDDMV
jgi:hypothetical protein